MSNEHEHCCCWSNCSGMGIGPARNNRLDTTNLRTASDSNNRRRTNISIYLFQKQKHTKSNGIYIIVGALLLLWLTQHFRRRT